MRPALPALIGFLFMVPSVAQAQGGDWVTDRPPVGSQHDGTDHLEEQIWPSVRPGDEFPRPEQMGVMAQHSMSTGTAGPNASMPSASTINGIIPKIADAEDGDQSDLPGLDQNGSGGRSGSSFKSSPGSHFGDRDERSLTIPPNASMVVPRTSESLTRALTVKITGVPARFNSTADLTATFTFSEAVTGFEKADVTVTGGTGGTFSGSGTTYTLVVTPDGSANLVVTVAANAATDGTESGPAAEVSATAVWDVIGPSVTITGVPDRINSRRVLNLTLNFSEKVDGSSLAFGFLQNVTWTGATRSGLPIIGPGFISSASLSLRPNGSEDVVISMAANSVMDGLGNRGPASTVSATATWDATAPTVTISDVPARIASTTAFTATFTFSEDVTGFETGDVSVSGGTRGTFTATNATTYSLKVTPTSGSNVTITVAADAVTDGLNTGPKSAVSATATWDAAAPTVAISDVPERINSTTNFTATFTFSEDVTGFETGDVSVSDGTKGTFSGSGKSYTLEVTPDGSADVVVTVAADAATDGFNTGPSSAVSATATWDDTGPTVTISDVPANINSTTNFTATFTFSEDVTGFETGDVSVSGGKKGTFGGSGKSYTLLVTPSGSADVVVTVPADAATDGLNTGPASAVSATATWDSAPTVTISDVPARINSTTAFTSTFTFSENVTGFVTDDVSVSGGSKGAFSGSGTSYTLVVTPTGGSNVTITVAAHSATDGVNTGPASAVSATATWDSAPTVTISDVPARINSTTAFTATFTFSENVTGFVTNDVTVTGGKKGAFSGSGKSYTLVVTPSGSADVVVTVVADAATDGLNTGPASAVSATATWDYPPTVSIDVPGKINGDALFTATITFSEDVTGFATGDVTVTGGRKESFAGSGKSYTVAVKPNFGSSVTVTVAANSVSDGLNTGPVSETSATATWDNTAPQVTSITDVPALINSKTPFTATFTFSEDVTGFTARDVAVLNGSKGAVSGGGKSYTLVVTPTGGASVTVYVNVESVTDGVNLGPTTIVEATATWASTAPTVTIGLPSRINSTTEFSVPLTYSRTVTGFEAADITVAGGMKGTFSGSGTDYTLLVTPEGSEDLVVTVAADAATDGVNTGPASAVSATATWDATAPTVTIGLPPKINSTTNFTATFTFSEPVTGFSRGDVTVVGGRKGQLRGSGKNYSIPVTPNRGSNVAVIVPAHRVTDGLNTGPPSLTQASTFWDATAPTLTIGGVPSTINSTTALNVTFTFSEDVTGFETGDVTVSGGKKSTFSGSGKSYTLVVTPSGSADVVVTVAANAATDGVNTGPASELSATATWDTGAPTVTIGGVPATINSRTALSVTFTFSKSVTGFITDDVMVTGGSKGMFSGSGSNYTLAVTPSGTADVVVTVAANSATDGVNTGPASEVSATATWDATAPGVVITDVPAKISSVAEFTAKFIFTEDVTGFKTGDVAVTGGRKGTFSATNATTYSLKVTPTSGSNVTLIVAADAATDGLNTGPASPVLATATWDAAAPTVTISDVPAKINSTTALKVTFTFSEDVTGFETEDVTVSGGQKGTFTATNASAYTLSVTPTDGSNVTITVAANAATDGLNSGPASEVSATATWDATVPTVTIADVPLEINSTAPFTAKFTFSEDVTGFDTDDVTVSGGRKGSFNATNATTYSLVVTPTRGSNVTLTVAANAATDGLNTGPASEVSATATWNAAALTVAIGGLPARINSRTALNITFTFSSAVTGFVTGDVTVAGGRKGTFSGSGRNYTLAVTPSGSAAVVVTVADNSATDGTITGPASAVSATATWDATAPTVTISDVPAKINSTTALNVTFTFSEDVTGFETGDVTVSGGRKGTFTATNATTYTLAVTPTSGSNVTLTVAPNAATDGLNTGPAAAVTATATWDATVPTVTISDVPATINSTAQFTAAFTFSEAVTGFVTDDVSVAGGTKGTFSGSGTTYTLLITPNGSANVVVTVAAGAATDGVNTGPVSAVSATALWDAEVLTVGITDVPATINSTAQFTATFTFSADVTGFVSDDVAVTGGTKGTFSGSGTTYTLLITPSGSENVVVTVAAGAATDGVNTGPASAVSATAIWDAGGLTVAITGVPAKINSTAQFTAAFTFSENVTDFVTEDIAVSGGTKGTFAGSGTTYTLQVTPEGSADVVVAVAANAATAGVNTGPALDVSATATWDVAAPVVTIGLPSKINSTDALNVTFTFSENVTGFETGDVTVSGGTKGTFTATNATSYTLAVTPTNGSNVTVTVAADALTDGLNTGPESTVSATAIWDATAPTVAITGVPAVINSMDPFTATFTFSEDVTEFVTDDVTVVAGTKGAFSGSGTTYALVVTPAGSADVVVTVAANAATDGLNTGPESAVSAMATWDTEGLMVEISGVPAKINSMSQFVASFIFSEEVTGFDAEDVALAGGTKGVFAHISGTNCTLEVTPSGNANVVIVIAENSVTYGSGNTGPPSEVSITAIWDVTAPAVTITDVPATINSTIPFIPTFTFSEEVTGFDTDDVVVTGGTKGTFSGSGTTYRLVVTPEGLADMVVTVKANAATDGVNTGPSAAISATTFWDGTGVTMDDENLPISIALWGNYPNPVLNLTNIVFDMPERAQISIRVTDMLGRIVQLNHLGWYEAGRDHTVKIGTDYLTAGVYFYTLRAEMGDRVIQRSRAMSVVR